MLATETWNEKRRRVAAAVLSKIGTATRGVDGEDYVVSEALRRKIAAAILAHEYDGVSFSIHVTINEWYTIPPCPIQRNTEEHYKERAEDFFVVTTSQKEVIISVQEDGDVYVLDAHTRTYGWKNKLIPESEIPDVLNCSVRCVKDLAATKREYETIDSQKQGKDGNDQLFSACRANNFIPIKGGFVHKARGLVDAMRTAFKTLAAYEQVNKSMLRRATETPNLKKTCPPKLVECVRRFKAALQALDRLNPGYEKFKGAVAQAMLLAYVKYVEIGFDDATDEAKLLEFFTKYRDGLASSKDGKFDAVYNFDQIRKEAGGGAGNRKEKLPRLLGAIERYIENGPNKMYTHDGIINMAEYFTSRTALSKGNGARRKKKNS